MKWIEKYTGEIKMIDCFEALRELVIDDDNGTLGIIDELEKQYKALQIENDLLKRENKALDEECMMKCELNQKLINALDKACEELENLSYVKGLGQVGRNFKEWKEWCLESE